MKILFLKPLQNFLIQTRLPNNSVYYLFRNILTIIKQWWVVKKKKNSDDRNNTSIKIFWEGQRQIWSWNCRTGIRNLCIECDSIILLIYFAILKILEPASRFPLILDFLACYCNKLNKQIKPSLWHQHYICNSPMKKTTYCDK